MLKNPAGGMSPIRNPFKPVTVASLPANTNQVLMVYGIQKNPIHPVNIQTIIIVNKCPANKVPNFIFILPLKVNRIPYYLIYIIRTNKRFSFKAIF